MGSGAIGYTYKGEDEARRCQKNNHRTHYFYSCPAHVRAQPLISKKYKVAQVLVAGRAFAEAVPLAVWFLRLPSFHIAQEPRLKALSALEIFFEAGPLH